MIFNDTIESVLSNDNCYISICDKIDNYINDMENVKLEKICDDLELSSQLSRTITGLDDDIYDINDTIDRETYKFDEEYDEIISDDIGNVIDIVSGL